ncbi:hypothetical protein JZ751_024169 [Albula glossodonta]|uniref:Uncharacterized protein n=1 Tax=Albula glossodonta TaxID=121402 RepID=A0A8T2NNK9_9TELE|nr:hypothetical protein JZ751_024169 [Albula glossodonta]
MNGLIFVDSSLWCKACIQGRVECSPQRARCQLQFIQHTEPLSMAEMRAAEFQSETKLGRISEWPPMKNDLPILHKVISSLSLCSETQSDFQPARRPPTPFIIIM